MQSQVNRIPGIAGQFPAKCAIGSPKAFRELGQNIDPVLNRPTMWARESRDYGNVPPFFRRRSPPRARRNRRKRALASRKPCAPSAISEVAREIVHAVPGARSAKKSAARDSTVWMDIRRNIRFPGTCERPEPNMPERAYLEAGNARAE